MNAGRMATRSALEREELRQQADGAVCPIGYRDGGGRGRGATAIPSGIRPEAGAGISDSAPGCAGPQGPTAGVRGRPCPRR